MSFILFPPSTRIQEKRAPSAFERSLQSKTFLAIIKVLDYKKKIKILIFFKNLHSFDKKLAYPKIQTFRKAKSLYYVNFS